MNDSNVPPAEFSLPASMVPDVAPDPAMVPKDAATVVVLRDGACGLEVFLQRRVGQMAFAAGMTVFPGGGVDKRDLDSAIAWAGPAPAWWANRFGCAEQLAGALVCAAVRETFEESGVLLAGKSATTVVSDTAVYAHARHQLVNRELSFAEFLAREKLVLRADLLRPWGNWITPIGESRRYDTKFFVACLPDGQRADGNTSEADHTAWRRPGDALADFEAGRSMLLAPTSTTLGEISRYERVVDVLAEQREITVVTPQIVSDGDQFHVVLPGSPRYQEDA